jgi:hypothetical protein
MFRTPIPNEDVARLENYGSDQLIGLFVSYMKTESRAVDYGQLSDAWGMLFSHLYLSAEELIDEMQRGEHRLNENDECLLHEFIMKDCRNGGFFVMNVIKKGGSIDRAALIMIADLDDLAGIESKGTTAIHLLADACDKRIRPLFIQKAGKNLLSSVYDRRGIPPIYTIFSLADLCISDLNAIAAVFSMDDLKKVMCRNRSGKNAFTVFSEAELALKSHASLERHMFFKTSALKDTDPDREN